MTVEQFIVEYGIRSILDVGCGDLCWISSHNDFLPKRNIRYLGLDIAQPVLKANRARFPYLEFREFDLLSDELPDDYDLLLCFDVLIHQCRPGDFSLALEKLLSATKQFGLISYGTYACTQPAVPVTTWQDAVVAERDFHETYARYATEIPLAEVRLFGDFAELVRRRDTTIDVCELGRYRFQTIYQLTRASDRVTSPGGRAI